MTASLGGMNSFKKLLMAVAALASLAVGGATIANATHGGGNDAAAEIETNDDGADASVVGTSAGDKAARAATAALGGGKIVSVTPIGADHLSTADDGLRGALGRALKGDGFEVDQGDERDAVRRLAASPPHVRILAAAVAWVLAIPTGHRDRADHLPSSRAMSSGGVWSRRVTVR
jgi:hypothetical protein